MNLSEKLRLSLMEQIDPGKDQEDERILEMIDELILNQEESRCLPVVQKDELRRELFYSVRRLDVLQELLDDPEITEIMVNGYSTIYIERHGKIEKYRKAFPSREKFEDVIWQIVGRCNRVVNEQNPIVDARLENGDRVNVVMRPVALNGPILTIRRFPLEAITMEYLIACGSITREAAELMKYLVRERYTIMIGGATGSGKTTFLNALSAFIPRDERIITIEDNAELQIQGIDNLVRLEAREANMENGTEITIRDLIRTALRMRPSRIVIGEVRGEETFELLAALHTGHAGSISTAHANSTKDMIHRIETMVLMGTRQLPLMAIRRQIASGIDILVHLGRDAGGSRRVEEIAQIMGMEEEEVRVVPLYQWEDGYGLRKKADLSRRRKE
ncbi:MAG: ATPase, T2SS/T4P/T4SS family [Lachnospiraceae bacterium]|nr:ATPase, T2SS/T4P/T4SS family [Lachnospiraceae bacterium]